MCVHHASSVVTTGTQQNRIHCAQLLDWIDGDFSFKQSAGAAYDVSVS